MHHSIFEYCDFSLAFSSEVTHMRHIHFSQDAAKPYHFFENYATWNPAWLWYVGWFWT